MHEPSQDPPVLEGHIVGDLPGPTPQQQGQIAAVQLADALRGGWTPPTVEAPIARYQDEQIYATTACQLLEFSGANVNYRSGFAVGFGSPLLLAATIGGSLLYNSHQKNKAQAAAAPQWRGQNAGPLHVTNYRFALQGQLGWQDLFYNRIRASECLVDGIVIFFDGQPPLKLAIVWPEYFFVLFQWFAYHTVPKLTIDPSLAAFLPPRGLGAASTQLD
jgi:hypothetical protein